MDEERRSYHKPQVILERINRRNKRLMKTPTPQEWAYLYGLQNAAENQSAIQNAAVAHNQLKDYGRLLGWLW